MTFEVIGGVETRQSFIIFINRTVDDQDGQSLNLLECPNEVVEKFQQNFPPVKSLRKRNWKLGRHVLRFAKATMKLWNWSIVPIKERIELDISDLSKNTHAMNSIDNCLKESVEVCGHEVQRKYTIRLWFDEQQASSPEQLAVLLGVAVEDIAAFVNLSQIKPGGRIFYCDIALIDDNLGNFF